MFVASASLGLFALDTPRQWLYPLNKGKQLCLELAFQKS